MQVTVGYGKDTRDLELAPERLIGVYLPNAVAKIDQAAAIEEALAHPLGAASFADFIAGPDRIVVIVNDGTRPTPTARILARIYPQLRDKDLLVIVATGCHRAPTEEEWDFILGPQIHAELTASGRLHSHDARRDPMLDLGTSSNGTPMLLNEIVATARKVLVIGSVEPHYFAGYTGGRKAFLPGTAAFGTIEANHKLALDPRAQALTLAGNPVHEDMMDAMSVLGDIKVFSIQAVLDADHDICAVHAGDLAASFAACIAAAEQVFCVQVPAKADVVVSVAPYPMDVDLYQSQKALDNGKLALAPGGVLILVATCRSGIGEKGFFDLMAGADTPQEVLDTIAGTYRLGYHKAAKMAEIALWAKVWAYTDLEDADVRAVHMTPVPELQEALDAALALRGPDARVVVLPFGSMTVPKLPGDAA